MRELYWEDFALWNVTAEGEWLDAIFYDCDTEECFLVELKKQEGETMEDFIARCAMIARENFEEPKLVRLCTDEYAEMLGYDTY